MVLGGILGVVCERRTSESFAVIWGRYTYYLLLMGVAYWGYFGEISEKTSGDTGDIQYFQYPRSNRAYTITPMGEDSSAPQPKTYIYPSQPPEK